MLQILLHSSKTMTNQLSGYAAKGKPKFEKEASELAAVWSRATTSEIAKLMHISDTKTAQVRKLYEEWSAETNSQIPAIDSFKGDIYSGLQVGQWSKEDRKYAHEHLVILSGLYGALLACDGIMPYRLEMGYKLPDGENMYSFWGDKLARIIAPQTSCIINLSAVEYTKAILPYVNQPVITPKFMTINSKTGEQVFVVVHAKIARGAFARWMIQNQIDDIEKLSAFNELNYRYDKNLSSPEQPVFVCQEFEGIGLSVRI